MGKKKPTREERKEILADMMVRDQELGLYDDEELYKMPDDKWDFYSGLPNPSAYMNDEEEEWDEDDALDQVLNDMVNDLDDDDFEWFPDSKT
jgi:hypothetical protein